MPVSEDDLLSSLLRGYAEEVRTTASLTRHLGLAARIGDRAGFTATSAHFEVSKKRCEALLLSIRICREMKEARSASPRHGGWSVVPAAAPETVFAPALQNAREPLSVDPAA